MGIFGWLNQNAAGIGVVVTVLVALGGLYAYLRYGRKGAGGRPNQRAGDRGVNIGGDNSGDVNTGSQTAPRRK